MSFVSARIRLRAALPMRRRYGLPCRPDRATYIANGFKAASDAPARIREWWTKHPAAHRHTKRCPYRHFDVKSRVVFATPKKLNLCSLNLRCTVRKFDPVIITSYGLSKYLMTRGTRHQFATQPPYRSRRNFSPRVAARDFRPSMRSERSKASD